MVLKSMSKGSQLDWSEDSELYDRFNKWKCEKTFLVDRMKPKKESNGFVIHCIKAWSGETRRSHTENARLSDKDSKKLDKVLEVLELQQ